MPQRPVNLPLLQVPLVGYGPDEPAMVEYRRRGTERALALGNRGAIRFDESGALHPDILQAYREHGFYAVPLICAAGDVAMCNRQAVHGSFANTSPDVRVTINFGFHQRRSVLNVTSGGVHNPVTTYDQAYIRTRSRLIPYAIDARRQRFPDEEPYRYRPLAADADRYRWTPDARIDIRDYNLMDLGI